MSGKQKFEREFALAAGRIVAKALDSHVDKLAYVGSFRRGLPLLGDLDMLVIPNFSEKECMEAFRIACADQKLLSNKDGLSVCDVLFDGMPVPVNVFTTVQNQWGAALMYSTGSREYNIRYRSIAKDRGLLVNEYGVFDRNGKPISDSGYSERAVCRAIGIPWVSPSERELKPIPTWCIEHQVPDFCKRERMLARKQGGNHDERA